MIVIVEQTLNENEAFQIYIPSHLDGGRPFFYRELNVSCLEWAGAWLVGLDDMRGTPTAFIIKSTYYT